MSDTTFITGVVIHARHGVMEHETEVGLRFVIDLELSADLSASSRTDRLADTVSSAVVVPTATAAFKTANYKLLVRAAGVADPQRIGIGGWSYGGTLIAWAITQTSRFRCAVVGAGCCDWVSSADCRTSREGIILMIVPAWTVVKPFTCNTDWKIE